MVHLEKSTNMSDGGKVRIKTSTLQALTMASSHAFETHLTGFNTWSKDNSNGPDSTSSENT